MIRERTFASMKLSDVMTLVVKTPSTIMKEASVNELLKKVIEDTKTRHVYVVDDSNRLTGYVRMARVVEYLFPFTSMMLRATSISVNNIQKFDPQNVEEIMDCEPFYLKEDSTMYDAAQILIKEKINELPVVDDGMRVVGQLNVYELITAYLNKVQGTHENK